MSVLSEEYSAGFEAACAINAAGELIYMASRLKGIIRDLQRTHKHGALTKYELKTLDEAVVVFTEARVQLTELAQAIRAKEAAPVQQVINHDPV